MLGLPYICVLTKLDEMDLGEDPILREKFLEDARASDLCRHLPSDANFPVVNYSDDEITDPGVDEHLIQIIKKVQEKSQLDLGKVRRGNV